ncbi:hypothetical protein OIU77_000980 [Salix suchowensis]|uniref:TFIIS-type domain-containing protein n=1 Tax=Salix suchowensis TaxID=1278906 RepID=A0ABQ9BA06_9ROSI|nr:hypothetical protein OIU77_000980 [Salix suchowensis]
MEACRSSPSSVSSAFLRSGGWWLVSGKAIRTLVEGGRVGQRSMRLLLAHKRKGLKPNMGQAGRFYCPTCPYFASIESRVKIKREQKLAKKEIEPIFTLEDMKKGGAETDATCPHCNFGRACFQQIQIRSADEPATTFYFCLNDKCGKMWRED